MPRPGGLATGTHDVEVLVEELPHTHCIQAEFAEVDDLHDLHVPWEQIVPTLLDHGWSGWLSSGYEGRREPYRGAARFAASTRCCAASRPGVDPETTRCRAAEPGTGPAKRSDELPLAPVARERSRPPGGPGPG